MNDPLNGRIERSPAYGTHGAVVSGHSLASIEGLRVLDSGGSVVDAMLATSAVLSVVIPQATSLGSDAFILYWDAASSRFYGLNASGPAPALARPEHFPNGMVPRGPLAANVPGMVRGWEVLHRKFGKLTWKSLFDRAIDLARDGHPISRILARNLISFRAEVEKDPGCRNLYIPNGDPVKVGQVLKQPALASSLALIADEGSPAFYEGPLGKSIGDYSRANAGLLDASDFKNYQPEWVDPIETNYRGLSVRVMPPNSFGLLMLMQLNALGTLPSSALAGDDAPRIAHQLNAMKAALATGRKAIADSKMASLPIAEMLSSETTARMAQHMQSPGQDASSSDQGCTSCIGIADAKGNAICVVQSVFHAFGAAFLDPTTGILLNNRMMGFTTEPGHPNQVAPRRRPAHTLNPVMVFSDGRPKYILATPGGPSQTMTIAQVITNLADRKLDLATAVEAPRWSVDREAGQLIELAFPGDIAGELAKLGHQVSSTKSASFFGSIKAVEIRSDNVLCAVADFRRESFAVASLPPFPIRLVSFWSAEKSLRWTLHSGSRMPSRLMEKASLPSERRPKSLRWSARKRARSTFMGARLFPA
jgi:gamma-glutamyltranspeptidase/glutathione hydrolase